MSGRDPTEDSRSASPLELLFDLTFVIPVGIGADDLAVQAAGGHWLHGLAGFALAIFASFVAWMNFSWFASAFDTDDWLYRSMVMLEMIGVVIFSLGLPRTFSAIDRGSGLSLGVMVAGFLLVRLAMVVQWLRAARDSPEYQKVARTYLVGLLAVQSGWVILAVCNPRMPGALIWLGLLSLGELLLAPLAQGRANGTPWHPHHIAERYSAFAIITLGECVVGTVALAEGAFGESARFDLQWQLVLTVVAGMVLTFGAWWVYFVIPFGPILHLRPGRGYLFGYGHLLIFGAIAGLGAGLHLSGLVLQGKAHVSAGAAALAVAVAVAVLMVGIFLIHSLLLGAGDRLHVLLLALTALLLAVGAGAAFAGVPLAVCLAVQMLAPLVTVVGFELSGHKFQRQAMERLKGGS